MSLRDKFNKGITFDTPTCKLVKYNKNKIYLIDFTSLRVLIIINNEGKWKNFLDKIKEEFKLPEHEWDVCI